MTSIPDSPKLCECGCGQPAPIAHETRAKLGYIKGQPRRFVIGHNARVSQPKPPKPPSPPVLCICGCGEPAPRGRVARRGHYSTARPAEQRGDVYVIPLTHGATCTVSPEDADLGNTLWRISAFGYTVRDRPKNGPIFMHRLILERMLGRALQPGEETDHKDGNRLNNTRDNLRLATHQQNMRNVGINKRNTSGYKGVCFARSRGMWVATIKIDGRNRQLGYFATPEAANEAYTTAAQLYYGEFWRQR